MLTARLPAIQRIDLIRIAKASTSYPHPALIDEVEKLTAMGPFADATEFEINSFDLSLDIAEE